MLNRGVEESEEGMAEKHKVRSKRQERIAEVDEAAIRLHIEPLAEGGYVATSRDVPGLVAEGRTLQKRLRSRGSYPQDRGILY